jgi:hypothetical protein
MIGYEFLISKIGIPMVPLQRPARIKPVTRVESMPEMLAVPRHVAPVDDSILSHVLFALRYETIQIPILDRALRLVSAAELLARLANKPDTSAGPPTSGRRQTANRLRCQWSQPGEIT